MREAVRRAHISGDGFFTGKCQERLQQLLEAPNVLLTTSCTDALEMAALLLQIQPGDEVIVPSFTFVSTVNAFVLHGATPKFADVRPDTLNLDEEGLEELITPRTRAVVPMHYAGVGCNMRRINEIAQKHGLAVVEDNAHGLLGKQSGRCLGTFGELAALSFHETKNFSCGEGGALVVNDSQLIRRAEILREKGTDRAAFFRGEVDKYTWRDVGSSYLPSDLLAAFLLAQLEAAEEIQQKRRSIWDYYFHNLQGWAHEYGIRLPIVSADCRQPYHMFYLLMPSLETREALLEHLTNSGIGAVFHYQPLHLSDMGRRYGGKRGECPVSERVSDRILRLPFYAGLTEEALGRVVSGVREFAWQRTARACR